jgi:hypothetical protein
MLKMCGRRWEEEICDCDKGGVAEWLECGIGGDKLKRDSVANGKK